MATPAVQQFCLRWNNHQPNFISVFSSLLNNESLVDVTLAAEGKHVQAHKIVLSACSTYFQSLFTVNPCQHPIVILKDIKYSDLKIIIDFIYCGEVNVSQEQLPAILKIAETLKIKGLAEMPEHNIHLSVCSDKNSDSQVPSPSILRRKRLRKSSTGSGSGSTEHTTTGGSEETVGSGVPSPLPVKMEPQSEGESSLRHEPSTESEPGFISQESVEDEPTPSLQQQSSSEDRNDGGLKSSTSMEESSTPSTSSQQHYPSGWGGSSQEDESKRRDQSQPLRKEHEQDCIIITPCKNLNPSSQCVAPQSQPSPCPSTDSQHSQQSRQSPCHHQCYPQSPTSVRRRRTNPQNSENFHNALEAVRVGGLGFCKAARLFGVNNRTLWLEYKRLGYPVVRRSLKNMKTEVTDPVEAKQNRSDITQSPWSPATTTASSNIFDASFFFQNQFENYLPVIKSSSSSSSTSSGSHSQQHNYSHHPHLHPVHPQQIKNYTNTGTIMLATNNGSGNLNVTDLSSSVSSNSSASSSHPHPNPHQPLSLPPPPPPLPPPAPSHLTSSTSNLISTNNVIKYE